MSSKGGRPRGCPGSHPLRPLAPPLYTDRMRVKITPTANWGGRVRVPADKSLTHRAFLLAAGAEGESHIENPLASADTTATRGVLEAVGTLFSGEDQGVRVTGRGMRFEASEAVLDCRNSGTTARLSLGLLSSQPHRYRLDGDESLRRRPMARVTTPLSRMGAAVKGDHLPLTIKGRYPLAPIAFSLPVPSAQVKSAVLLAALAAEGETVIEEPVPTRDHTERLMPLFGIDLKQEPSVNGGKVIRLAGPQIPRGARFSVPGDFSSAAFFVAAALMIPQAQVTVEDVGLNETRTGFLRILEAMGADVQAQVTDAGVEPRGTLSARYSPLCAVDLSPQQVSEAIDEMPLVFLLMTQARGRSSVHGAGELRVKESDRLATTAEALGHMGAQIKVEGDRVEITGPCRLKGAVVCAHGDHRIAMTAAAAALSAKGETIVEGAETVAVSFPDFFRRLRELGAKVEERHD